MTQSQQQQKNDSTNSSQAGAFDMSVMAQLVAQAVAAAMASQPQAQSGGQSELERFKMEMQAETALKERKVLKRQFLVHKYTEAKRKVSDAISREVKPGLNGGSSYEQHRCQLKTLLEAVKVFGEEAVEATIGGKISWTATSVGCKLNTELTSDELEAIEAEVEKVK